MNKLFRNVALVSWSALMMTSCGSDNYDYPEPEKPAGMTVEEQKAKLDNVVSLLIGEVKTEEIKEANDLLTYAMNHYVVSKDYNIGGLTTKYVLGLVKCQDRSLSDVGGYFLKLSAFTGKFTATKSGWVDSGQSDDVEMTFLDENGVECTLVLKASDDHYRYDNNAKINEIPCIYAIPKQIEATLTRDGKQMAYVVVNPVVKGEGGKDAIMANDVMGTLRFRSYSYDILCEKSDISGTQGCALNTTINLGADKTIKTTLTTEKQLYAKDTTVADSVVLTSSNPAKLHIDLLGKVVADGNISDLKAVTDYLNEARRNNTDQQAFKAALDKVNGCLNIGVYYDNSDERMASMILMAGVDRDQTTGKEVWNIQPAVYFSDGTSYLLSDMFSNLGLDELKEAFRNSKKRF